MNEFDQYNAKYNDEELAKPIHTSAKLPAQQNRALNLAQTGNAHSKRTKSSYWDSQMKLSDFVENQKRPLSDPLPSFPPAKKLKQTKLPTKTEHKTPQFKIGSAIIPVSLNEAKPSVKKFLERSKFTTEDKILSTSSEEEEQQEENPFITHQTVLNYVKSTEKADPIKETGPFMLTEPNENPPVFIPEDIANRLKHFQKVGVKFLFKLWQTQKGGILGDEMGLGKTVQTVSFINCLKGGKIPLEKAFFFSPTKRIRQRENSCEPTTKLPFLVVAPAGIIDQWATEFNNWAYLKVNVFAGKGKCRSLFMAAEKKIDVMITSYDLFRINFNDINAVEWACIIFDEVHKIKSQTAKLTKQCKKLKIQCRIGLTGTLIQNCLGELWAVSDILYPGFLGTLEEFKRNTELPIKTGQRHDATTSQIARGRIASHELSEKIGGFLLRRSKDCVTAELPGKEDNIIFCPLTPLQIACYKRLLDSPTYRNLRSHHKIEGEDWGKLVFPALMRLQKLCNHLALLQPSTKDKDQNSTKVEDDKYHQKIAFELGSDAQTIQEMIRTGKDSELSGKIQILMPMLKKWKSEGSKVLLFSNSTRMMDILGAFLRREKHSFERIDGSTPTKNRPLLVEQFNNSTSIFVFLVSTKACGLGLNLTAANIVVIFDPNWNAAWDLQAQDRAHRIGQTKFCKVYRFIASGTIEEMKYNRQIYKQQLSNITLDGQSMNQRRYFTGVAGVKGQEGEIFGLSNLFQLSTGSSLTNSIIERAVQQERDFMKDACPQDTQADDDVESDKLLLSELGVKYSHRTKDVLGESEFERQISLNALEMERVAQTTKKTFSKPQLPSKLKKNSTEFLDIS